MPAYDKFGLPLLDCEQQARARDDDGADVTREGNLCCLRTCSNVCFVVGGAVFLFGVVLWSAGRFRAGAVGFGAFCTFAGLITAAVPFIRCIFYRKEMAARDQAVKEAVETATAAKDARIAELSHTVHEKDTVIDDLSDELAVAQAGSDTARSRLCEALEAEKQLVRRAHERYHIGTTATTPATTIDEEHGMLPPEALSTALMTGARNPPSGFTMQAWNTVRDSLYTAGIAHRHGDHPRAKLYQAALSMAVCQEEYHKRLLVLATHAGRLFPERVVNFCLGKDDVGHRGLAARIDLLRGQPQNDQEQGGGGGTTAAAPLYSPIVGALHELRAFGDRVLADDPGAGRAEPKLEDRPLMVARVFAVAKFLRTDLSLK